LCFYFPNSETGEIVLTCPFVSLAWGMGQGSHLSVGDGVLCFLDCLLGVVADEFLPLCHLFCWLVQRLSLAGPVGSMRAGTSSALLTMVFQCLDWSGHSSWSKSSY
jgi:hypothetical protein